MDLPANGFLDRADNGHQDAATQGATDHFNDQRQQISPDSSLF
jgi:hypothetical protein